MKSETSIASFIAEKYARRPRPMRLKCADQTVIRFQRNPDNEIFRRDVVTYSSASQMRPQIDGAWRISLQSTMPR